MILEQKNRKKERNEHIIKFNAVRINNVLQLIDIKSIENLTCIIGMQFISVYRLYINYVFTNGNISFMLS